MALSASIDDLSARRSKGRRSATATPQTADERLHRAWRMAGVVVLMVLNALDLLTTYAFLDRGVEEANPIAERLLQTGTAGPLKAAILIALGWSVWRGKPKIASTCAIWLVNGVYVTVVLVNLLVLTEVS
jgi:hypothetical protein